MKKDKSIHYNIAKDRYVWLQMIVGQLQCNQQNLTAGDGAAISEETLLNLQAQQESEFLLFDLN